MPPNSPDHDTRELCQELLTCQDEDEALILAERLRADLHKRVEEIRGKLNVVPPLGSQVVAPIGPAIAPLPGADEDAG